MLIPVDGTQVKLPINEDYFNTDDMSDVREYCKSNSIKLIDGELYFKSYSSFQYFCVGSVSFRLMNLYKNDLQ